MFKKAGEYVYNVRELNENAAGYSYDDKVYTIKIHVKPNPDDPDVLICTQQTILDGENEVEVCEFVNNYESTENGDDNTDHGRSDNETDIESIDNTDDENVTSDDNNYFAKTGDQITLWVTCLAIAALVSLLVFIFIRNRKKAKHFNSR